ncbi:MAG: class I SAM-dependent methyltransferase [Chlamydiia bacterium]|nr:class I SAM-dependent methyltransferase [Chlamydiia bacterium]MCP5509660.1 class I SAM-dependent methyltransferase [Chlamydiales bacterium]
MTDSYQLIDSGEGEKLERFGQFLIQRPCAQALWPRCAADKWTPDARFTRDPGGVWDKKLSSGWEMAFRGFKFHIKQTDFGHMGIFPEHAMHWDWMEKCIQSKPARVLNLFAYSGAATLALAKAGAKVCHLDASNGMVDWARQNAQLNNLQDAPIRWIVDDAMKFLRREIKRESFYEGVILDPPSFGRGKQGQVFKIEDDLPELIALCQQVLSDKPLFTLLSCHTPGITPLVLHHLLGGGECGEMTISGSGTHDLPCGSFARRAYA